MNARLTSCVSLLVAFLTLPLSARAQGSGPHISSVTQVWARSYQTIKISGRGFGSLRKYDGDSAFIRITDLTQNWEAGHTGDAVTINIGSWSDSLITINYFDGAYGSGNQSLVSGDLLSIEVWNPQTGAGPAKAQGIVLANVTTLFPFTVATGFAEGTPVSDEVGNLYGLGNGGISNSACFGGTCGAVYELSKGADGTWSITTLYEFLGGADGWSPTGDLVRDVAGNLYGVTRQGGDNSICFLGCGTVFEVSHGVKTTLHTFAYNGDGAIPYAGLTMDPAGNMYGTTTYGGTMSCGTVYRLSPDGSGGLTYSSIYNFQCGAAGDGASPYSKLTLDSSGNLYGTTYSGGNAAICEVYQSGCGTIFELSPVGDGTFIEHVLHVFKGTAEGVHPGTGVTFDASGNLYGVTYNGGPPCSSRYNSGCGVAYALRPLGDGTWQERTIAYFSNNVNDVDGSTYPFSDLTYHNGVLYGYARGGASQQGTIYTIALKKGGWTESTIYSFNLGEGAGGQPFVGSDGTIYGVGDGLFTLP